MLSDHLHDKRNCHQHWQTVRPKANRSSVEKKNTAGNLWIFGSMMCSEASVFFNMKIIGFNSPFECKYICRVLSSAGWSAEKFNNSQKANEYEWSTHYSKTYREWLLGLAGVLWSKTASEHKQLPRGKTLALNHHYCGDRQSPHEDGFNSGINQSQEWLMLVMTDAEPLFLGTGLLLCSLTVSCVPPLRVWNMVYKRWLVPL